MEGKLDGYLAILLVYILVIDIDFSALKFSGFSHGNGRSGIHRIIQRKTNFV